MILESAQLLCTAHWINKYAGFIPRKLESKEWEKVREQKTNEPRDFPYLPTMHNHPCSIWVRSSLDNYEWLYRLTDELNKEYGYRYGGKSHKSMHEVVSNLPVLDIPRRGLTPFALAMPDSAVCTNCGGIIIKSFGLTSILNSNPFSSSKSSLLLPSLFV